MLSSILTASRMNAMHKPARSYEACRFNSTRVNASILTSLSVGIFVLLALLAVTGMGLAFEFAKFALIALSLFALAGYCYFRKLSWRLADCANAFAFATISLMVCGLVSCIGLRAGFPLADSLLYRTDTLIGFDTPKIVQFVAARPLVSQLLYFAYNSSGPLCIALALWLLFQKDRVRFWGIVVTLVVSMQIIGVVSILFPARGGAISLGLDALQGNGLPVGSGTYFANAFSHFYYGTDPIVMLKDMQGVVAFPSFHTVMALVVMQACSASGLRWPALAWSVLTIVSTIPMGGHYVVDLAAGFIVWLAAVRLAAWSTMADAKQ